ETGDADQGGRGDEQQWDHPGESVNIRISIAAAKLLLGERAVQGAYGGTMSSCCSSFFAANQRQFSDAVARRDLMRYRTRGPDQRTRLLRAATLGAGQGRTVRELGPGT